MQARILSNKIEVNFVFFVSPLRSVVFNLFMQRPIVQPNLT